MVVEKISMVGVIGVYLADSVLYREIDVYGTIRVLLPDEKIRLSIYRVVVAPRDHRLASAVRRFGCVVYCVLC